MCCDKIFSVFDQLRASCIVVVEQNDVFDKWHVTFHGTRHEALTKIFKGGLTLLKAGDVALGGFAIGLYEY